MTLTINLRTAFTSVLFSLFLANVQGAVAQDAGATVTLKKKVAIARFSNETR